MNKCFNYTLTLSQINFFIYAYIKMFRKIERSKYDVEMMKKYDNDRNRRVLSVSTYEGYANNFYGGGTMGTRCINHPWSFERSPADMANITNPNSI
jgi:hypothetical protein